MENINELFRLIYLQYFQLGQLYSVDPTIFKDHNKIIEEVEKTIDDINLYELMNG